MSEKKQNRQDYIMSVAYDLGVVSKERMAKELHTSVETIRRDIAELCDKKLLKKTLRGAEPYKSIVRHDASYISRVHQNRKELRTIGEAACSLIRDGMIIAFDSDTSIQGVAELISGYKNLTCVTASLPTAMLLFNKIEAGEFSGRVILVGGELNRDRCTAGSSANGEVIRYHFDLAFISCTSLSISGASSYNLDLCNFSRQLISNSVESVLIAESEKVGSNSLFCFADLSEFDRIIVDNKHNIPSKIKDYLEENNVSLTIVKLSKV